jgi:hypothetical protein
MNDTEPKYIEVESIKVIHLEPGDYLILEHPRVLSNAAYKNLLETVSEKFPILKGRIMILEEGMTAKVLRTGESR